MTIAESDAHPHDEHGPHRGPCVKTEEGIVEISVFETGVTPRFRLYFFDVNERATNPPRETVVIETVRKDGRRQRFDFRLEQGFLESTCDIPEPHEFEVQFQVSHEGRIHTYRTQFAEERHAHGANGHSHDEQGHDHDHGSGFFGWLKGLYGHSHSVVDKVDSAMESHERGIWALKVSLLGLGITAALQMVIVFLSGSVALLADTIHNFADAGTSIPLWIAFALSRRGANRRFTYGYGKAEDVAGVVIVLIIFFSACVAAYESIVKIIHPQPIANLGWVACAAVLGFLGNEAVAVFRINIGKEIGSAALIADGQHARVDGSGCAYWCGRCLAGLPDP